jgi:transcription antitermination factor NusG
VTVREVECEDIISSVCLHFVILSAKAELDEMVNGLKSLEVLTLVRSNPGVSRQLFVKGNPTPLTADSLYDMFTPELSPMSNRREKEEAQLLNWTNFLGFVEGMYIIIMDDLFTPF